MILVKDNKFASFISKNICGIFINCLDYSGKVYKEEFVSELFSWKYEIELI